VLNWFNKLRRQRVTAVEFPSAWREILRRQFPLYQRLSATDRKELEAHVQCFLAEKDFEGCGGLVITDEIRLTVAAQACVLLLRRPTNSFEQLRSILVYPSTYFARSGGHDAEEESSARLGESWDHGTVVLAWDSVLRGAANPYDGHNVVLHEFAHQLDQQDGTADGAPILGQGQPVRERATIYSTWARILGAEYEQLRHRTGKGRKSVLDSYGATKPAEFFAVATECFFEKPIQLRDKHPQLYAELKRYYNQDPAEWSPAFAGLVSKGAVGQE
jgi:Mlc titration factor MtfA (ptsG expression regulator)